MRDSRAGGPIVVISEPSRWRRVTLSPLWAKLRLTRLLNRNLSVYETYLSALIRGADIQLKLTVLK